MKISLNWLSDYIDIPVSKEELSDILTDLGLEVEGMETIEGVPGGLAGVLVGHIVECGKHPNADRLSLTKVDVGRDEPLQIVCGAPNVATGQKVLVATTGTTLHPTAGEPFKIKKGKIRGEVSEGMICAEDEIGIGNDHDGIMVLDNDAIPGTEAKVQLELKEDTIYDIGLTPNRSDATSHIGVARDLLAYYKVHKIKNTGVKLPDVFNFSVESNEHNNITVDIEDLEGCPRFSAVSLSQIEVKESPEWIQQRLAAIGVRAINNIVDITNYVLHETGQPLHAYDLNQIKGSKVVVKTLPEGSKFMSLDEKERILLPADIMVCNGVDEGMCIAGVFGGLYSGVTERTTNIFLEAAHFNAKRIRVTSTKHLLRTDAAMRFEKGTDPNGTLFALKRAAKLMEKYANASISSDIIDIYPNEIEPVKVNVRYEKVNDLIGIDMSKETISKILNALDMEIIASNDESFTVKVPTNKADVHREADIVEEILRVYGFNNIPISNKMSTSISYLSYPQDIHIKESISQFLTGKGYNEMMNLSLIQSQSYEKILPHLMDGLVYINNTSNIHLDVMRPEMLLPALQTVVYNQNRQSKNLKYFEIGRQYKSGAEHIEESHKLIAVLTGSQEEQNWNQENRDVDFYALRRMVDELLIKIGGTSHKTTEIPEDERWDYGMTYERGKDHIVSFGKVKASICNAMDISTEVYYAEFDLKMLYTLAQQSKTKIKAISKFPTVKRDLALVVNSQNTFNEIEAIVRKADKKLIKEVGLFDVYKNDEQLGAGKKSYAISILFEDPKKTLNDKEVEKVMSKLIGSLKHQLQAEVR